MTKARTAPLFSVLRFAVACRSTLVAAFFIDLALVTHVQFRCTPYKAIANTTNQVALCWGKQLKFELRERTLLALTGPRTTPENPN